jgi:hypothetical protein
VTDPTLGTTPDAAAPASVERDSVGRDVLESRALLLERSVLKMPGVTPEVLQAQRPGGVANRDPSAMGWLTYLNWLHGMRGVAAPGAARPTTADGPMRWSPQVVDDLRRAFAAEPIFVTLESGKKVGVYPKGLVAASRIVRSQLVLEWVHAQRLGLLKQRPTTPAIVEALDEADRCAARLEAEWVWCVTHPGPRLPWALSGPEASTVSDPEPPADFHDTLTQSDLLLLRRAFLEVNYFRIATLAERMQRSCEKGTSESAPLAHFLGVIASEHGVQAETMALDWTVGAAFAAALSRAESTTEATRRAKEKGERTSPTGR